ncbi:hypothetical protein BU202_01025 [Streptococcus cuniculi]|uniref:Uncharacterized protein n=1 Tax=Streptococcus cuniculi TaxID=1432788 RepID=A0A1Q8EAS6_9STRE|nr:hypothetical protein BU202_01025 [Streptococcus cuniculi]
MNNDLSNLNALSEKIITSFAGVINEFENFHHFLLKFARKERVIQRRTDIFVQALEILGFVTEIDAQTYALTMDLDKGNLVFRAIK